MITSGMGAKGILCVLCLAEVRDLLNVLYIWHLGSTLSGLC